MEILFGILILLGLFGTIGYSEWRSEHSPKAKREKFLLDMERSPVPENRERAQMIRQRDAEIKFKLIEGKQAADILSNSSVRKRLEKADIDVENLQYLLMADEDVTKLLEE